MKQITKLLLTPPSFPAHPRGKTIHFKAPAVWVSISLYPLPKSYRKWNSTNKGRKREQYKQITFICGGSTNIAASFAWASTQHEMYTRGFENQRRGSKGYYPVFLKRKVTRVLGQVYCATPPGGRRDEQDDYLHLPLKLCSHITKNTNVLLLHVRFLMWAVPTA